MEPISYRCHRFPPEIIQNAVWLYCRFTLSYRDVEDLLSDRARARGLFRSEAVQRLLDDHNAGRRANHYRI